MLKKLQDYVEDINQNIEKLDCRGPVSKYVLPDENLKGRYAFIKLLCYSRHVDRMILAYEIFCRKKMVDRNL